jgi:polysaccharide export outer membrane protein
MAQLFMRLPQYRVGTMISRRTLIAFAALPLAACAHRPDLADLPADPFGASPYQLATGDRLRVIVFGQDNLSNVYAVDGAGRISMPLIGAVDVAGKTTQQLERAIESRLRAGYLREPKVSVDIDAYRPFFILGEVTQSGQFPFVNGMTVQTGVAIAGGFTARAQRGWAEVTRMVDGQLMTAAVPIHFPVRPGDTVVIKERWF